MTRDEIVRVIDNYTNISAQRSLREGEKYQLGLHRLALRGLDLEARVRELEEEVERLRGFVEFCKEGDENCDSCYMDCHFCITQKAVALLKGESN